MSHGRWSCCIEARLQLVALALDLEQLDVEDERGAAWDLGRRPARAVPEARRDRQPALLAVIWDQRGRGTSSLAGVQPVGRPGRRRTRHTCPRGCRRAQESNVHS